MRTIPQPDSLTAVQALQHIVDGDGAGVLAVLWRRRGTWMARHQAGFAHARHARAIQGPSSLTSSMTGRESTLAALSACDRGRGGELRAIEARSEWHATTPSSQHKRRTTHLQRGAARSGLLDGLSRIREEGEASGGRREVGLIGLSRGTHSQPRRSLHARPRPPIALEPTCRGCLCVSMKCASVSFWRKALIVSNRKTILWKGFACGGGSDALML